MPSRPQTHKPAKIAAPARPSSNARGYTYRWQQARAAYLQEHPFCIECEKEGRIERATVVDHKEPHRGNQELLWDESNWQALCARHHNRKTAREDGGFGR